LRVDFQYVISQYEEANYKPSQVSDHMSSLLESSLKLCVKQLDRKSHSVTTLPELIHLKTLQENKLNFEECYILQ
jgi:hypothetical protein